VIAWGVGCVVGGLLLFSLFGVRRPEVPPVWKRD
jgi:hypothetical protein